MTDTNESLEERVARLERQYRRWPRGCVLAIVTGLGLQIGLGATQAPEHQGLPEVTAQRFMLVDKNGTRRGDWYTYEDGKPTLVLNVATGNERVASLGVRPDGASSLNLHSKDDAPDVQLTAHPDGGGICVNDKEGRVRGALRLYPEGKPAFLLNDEKYRRRVVLGSYETTSLTLFDAEGNTRAFLDVSREGQGGLALKDSLGRVSTFAP